MPDQLEIRGPHGERLLTPVRPGTFVVGSDPAADVRIEWPGVGPRHFRFVRTDAGVRIEPVRAGATVAVNGEELFCKELVPGDVLAGAGVQLRWRPDAAPEPPRVPPAPAAAGASPPASRTRAADVARRTRAREREPARPARAREDRPASRRARPRGTPVWVPVTATFVGVLLLALLAYRWFSGSTWPSSPQHYVDLARTQFQNLQPETALTTLAFALREATGPVRAEALQLEAEIRRLMVELAEAPKVTAAQHEHDLLLGYAARYLGGDAQRPAARDFVRQCDRWLERHREVCARVADGEPLLQEIERLRARYAALAALGEPDTAADAIFAARARLRFQWRDYRGAVAALDAFLAAHPDDAAARAERDTMLRDGEQWVGDRLRNVDRLLGRGDVANAEKDLDQLERWSVLPQWAPMLAERRAKLPGTR